MTCARRMPTFRRWLATLVAIVTLWATPAAAQGLGLMEKAGSGPLQVNAVNGLEWNQKAKTYTAIGSATARRGDVELRGDRLIAFYEETAGGSSDITKIEAIGKVVIESPTERAQGDHGVYDLRQGMMVLTGRALELRTPTDRITARDSLEYDERGRIAVARGEALAARGTGEKAAADLLVAYLVESPPPRGAAASPAPAPGSKAEASGSAASGGLRVQRVRARGDVCLQSPNAIGRGLDGEYNLDTGIAVLVGNVQLAQGPNRITGSRATMDMKTGVSRMDGPSFGQIEPGSEQSDGDKNGKDSEKGGARGPFGVSFGGGSATPTGPDGQPVAPRLALPPCRS